MSLVHAIKTGNDGVKTIKKVQFGVLSPEKILAEGVADIHKHMTKGGELQGTLMDPRLGATRTTKNTVTGLDSKMDPGLFGYCVLALPVYHPIFFGTIHNVLRVVCPNCSAIREHNEGDTKVLRKKIKTQRIAKPSRLSMIQDHVKSANVCTYCGTSFSDVQTDKTQILGFAFSSKGKEGEKIKEPKNAKVIYDILKRISDADSELMGLDPKHSRPEWLMYTILPVPPPTMRPSVVADNNKTSDDDITQSLHNIIKSNNILSACLADEEAEATRSGTTDMYGTPNVVSTWQSLQSQIASLVDNETNSYAKVCNRAQRPLKTIKGRHKGKAGRLRNNLMGKRTNYSARTVITADPNLGLDEVGVPIEMAYILTYPEVVNAYNIDALTSLVRRGPNVYPGAKEIKKPGQSYTIDLDCIQDRDSIRLEHGTIVYRHVIDGDIVLFNRQPSLHRMNMMAHYVKILPGRSFRISANITQPYGADFDGDEMNLHLPQSEMTRREIEMLALSPTQICSPQSNAPVVGAVQDTMLATYRASSEQTRGYNIGEPYNINIKDFMNLALWINNTPERFENLKDNKWTMQDLINLILPPITLSRRGKGDSKLVISNGKLIVPKSNKGEIVPMAKSNSLLGASAGSIFHIAWNDLGPTTAKNLMDDLSRVMSQWLMISGFSVGLRDLEIPKVYMDEIDYDKEAYLDKAYQLIEGLNNGNYTDKFRESLGLGKRGLTANDYDQFEQDMMFILDTCRNRVQEYVAKHIYEYDVQPGKQRIYDNRFMSMVASGSKGKPTNAVQIVGTLGQQVLSGARAGDYYYRRPLPFVPKDDLSPEGRGFVINSYNKGLNFMEYIYHAMAGRMGVISTSIKTADTGYLQRKLMKRLEDIGTYYDGTVRLAGTAIVQYVYGGDGYDGSKVEKQYINHITHSIDEIKLKYGYSNADWDVYKTFLPSTYTYDEAAEKEAVNDEVLDIIKDWKYLRDRYQYNIPDSVPSVVNFDRLIDGILSKMESSGSLPYLNDDSVLKPSHVREAINTLVTDKLKLPTNESINHHCMKQFVALLRSKICSKKLIIEKGYNKFALDRLMDEIHYKFYNGIVTPGEAVGAIAAQSIGEPGTQMTLDAFHSTGAKITVSGGVPRFKEILSLTKMKTPSVSIYLQGLSIPQGMTNLIRTKADLLGGVDGHDNVKTIAEVDEFLLKMVDLGHRDDAKQLKKELESKYLQEGENSILRISERFEYITMRDLVDRSEIIFVDRADNDPDKDDITEAFCFDPDPPQYPMISIRFELNRDKLVTTSTDLDKWIASSLDAIKKFECNGKSVMRAIYSMNELESINQKESELLKATIRGISDIVKTTVRKEKRDIRFGGKYGKVVKRSDSDYKKLADVMMSADDYIIDTVGSNISDILGMDNVDPYRTYSNDINEMHRTFGIEVGRKSIIREIKEVLENSAKANIDHRHLALLADAMTCRGFMQKIDRYGAKKGESGPLALASFEETTTVLSKAAVYSEEDPMAGVSSNVMFGQYIKLGTNAFDLYLDETMLLEYGVPPKKEDMQDSGAFDIKDIEMCTDEGMMFDFAL
jgi:DNA-directed RNA polymerase II subunit RPB1